MFEHNMNIYLRFIYHLPLRTPTPHRSGLLLWLPLLLSVFWAAFPLALFDVAHDPAHWRKTEHVAAARPQDVLETIREQR